MGDLKEGMLEAQRAYDEKYREACIDAISISRKGILALEPGHGTAQILLESARRISAKNILIVTTRADAGNWCILLQKEGATAISLASTQRKCLPAALDGSWNLSGAKTTIWLATDDQVYSICSWRQETGTCFEAVFAMDAWQFMAPSSERCKAMRTLADRADMAIGITGTLPEDSKKLERMQIAWGPAIKPDLPRQSVIAETSGTEAGIIEARENVHGPDPVLFEVTEEHVKLFARLNLYTAFDVDDTTKSLEIAPAISWKRPFGNSGGIYDACCILGYADEKGEVTDRLYKKAMYLMASLPVAIQCFAVSGRIAPGTYRTDKYGSWFHYRNVAPTIFWKEAIESCAQLDLDAAKAAEFVANTGVKSDNPYHALASMREYFQGTEENRRILKEFENYALERFESCHDLHGYDREAALSSMICGSVTMPDDGWPFGA